MCVWWGEGISGVGILLLVGPIGECGHFCIKINTMSSMPVILAIINFSPTFFNTSSQTHRKLEIMGKRISTHPLVFNKLKNLLYLLSLCTTYLTNFVY